MLLIWPKRVTAPVLVPVVLEPLELADTAVTLVEKAVALAAAVPAGQDVKG